MKLSRDHTVSVLCFAVAAGMTGMAYAAVPLYDMFCRVTGYSGTPSRADHAPGATGDSMMTIRFDTNVDPALPWSFEPEKRTVRVRLGEDRLVFFQAVNRSAEAIVGRATFNVVPESAARYFNKIQCFCFSEQKLEAGQSVEMPVSFFIAPEIAQDHAAAVTEITLSYTFFPAIRQKAQGKTAFVPAIGSGG